MRENNGSTRTVVALGLAFLLGAAGLLAAPGANAAPASAANCSNEERIDQGGDDFLLDVGPGLVYVGVDKGDVTAGGVCVGVPPNGIAVDVKFDKADIPQKQNSTACALDVGGCKVTAFTVGANDGDAYPLLQVNRTGLPAGNGTTQVPSDDCVIGIGTSC